MSLFKKRKKYWWEEDEEDEDDEEEEYINPANWSVRQEIENAFHNPQFEEDDEDNEDENIFKNMDTSNMNLRQELEAKYDILSKNQFPTKITPDLFNKEGNDDAFEEEDDDEKKRQALEYSNKVKQSVPNSLDVENSIVMNDTSMSPLQKIGKMTWNNFKNFNPGIRAGEVAGELAASKQEMEEMNRPGYDNYAHRYAMYTNAKDGLDKAIYTLGGGVLKEAYDVYNKSIKGNTPFKESLSDSYKDTLNNIDAVYTATKNNFQGNDIDGRLWLDDFDYLHNRWKKKKRKRW